MSQISPNVAVPQAIAETLRTVSQKTLRMKCLTAFAVAVVVLLTAMGLAMLVDYLAVLYDSQWRSVLTATALVSSVLTLAAWIVVGWRYSRLHHSAVAVDRAFPDSQERWTTVSNLGSGGEAARNVHPAMYRQVATEAAQLNPRVSTQQVVRYEGFVTALKCLSTITAVLVLAVVINPRRTTVLMQRFWSPNAYISATEIGHSPSEQVIGRGESLDLVANLEGLPVKTAVLMLEPEQGDPKTFTLVPHTSDEQDRISHRIRVVKSSLKYRFRAGDGQTPWYQVEVADRPKIAATRIRVTPPAYTKQETKQVPRLPRKLSVLEGSRIEIGIKPQREVESVQLSMGEEQSSTLRSDADGWYVWSQEVRESFSFSPLLTEEHGLTNRKPPKCRIVCKPDRPPVVKVLTPRNEVAVRPDDHLEVTFVAKDDVGIGGAELVVFDESMGGRGKPKALKVIAIDLGDQQGKKEVKAKVKLDLNEFQLPDGAQLSYLVRVREDRGEAAQASDMSADAIAAVSPEDSTQDTSAAIPQIDSNQGPVRAATAGNDDQVAENVANADSENQPANSTIPYVATESKPEQLTDKTEANAPSPDAVADGSAQRTKQRPVGDQPASSQSKPQVSPAETGSQEARVASSGQQRILAGQQSPNSSAMAEANTGNNQKQLANSPAGNLASRPGGNRSSNPANNSRAATGNRSQQNSAASQQANQSGTPRSVDSQNRSSQGNGQQASNRGNRRPPDNMTKNTIDIGPARTATSNRMQVKVDQWAGSFEGQQREKLELFIAPLMAELDMNLEKAELMSRLVLDELDAGEAWRAKYNRDITQSEKRVMAAIQMIEDIEGQTNGTPYAFIGLQLLDISRAHIEPARREFWKSLQAEKGRLDKVREGWQHTRRARELMVMLTERFERAKREYATAESVSQIKKMHRIFVEESMGLLRPPGEGGNGYSRKAVEFDLDEEYLKRLKEVLELRNRMRKEFARILRDDPRLLRRYLDAQKNRQNNLRHNLYDLIEEQRELNREVDAWSKVEDQGKKELAGILLGRHVESSQDVSLAAAEMLDRFEAWSPIDSESENDDLLQASELMQRITTTATELTSRAEDFVAVELPNSDEAVAAAEQVEAMEAEKGAALDRIDATAEQLYDELGELEVQLRQLGMRSDRLEMANFATNRLVETNNLIAQSSAWVRQLRQQREGNYHRAAEVSQYRIARATDVLVAKLADVEQDLSGLLERGDGRLPENIAEAAREMFVEFDENATPNQQAAVYALRRNRIQRAAERQDAALTALEKAAQLYDEMIDRAIVELDKLPVQDPIAAAQDDPTLDELLEELEQESAITDLLGIPGRSSNLRVVTDFIRPLGDNGVVTGRYRSQLMNQMRQQNRLRRRQMDRAYRNAMKRALKEAEREDLVDKSELKLAGENSDWNVLLSQLGDDLRQGRDKAPPEKYRQAIEQYFIELSKNKNRDR